jgi:hypothetical protein
MRLRRAIGAGADSQTRLIIQRIDVRNDLVHLSRGVARGDHTPLSLQRPRSISELSPMVKVRQLEWGPSVDAEVGREVGCCRFENR